MVKITGGGIQSNKAVQTRSGVKTEPQSRAMSPEAVAQMGSSLAFKGPALDQGAGYTPAKMGGVDRPSYRGPSTAAPGSNRTIFPSGLQSPTPVAREMPPSRDYLNERPNKGNRP